MTSLTGAKDSSELAILTAPLKSPSSGFEATCAAKFLRGSVVGWNCWPDDASAAFSLLSDLRMWEARFRLWPLLGGVWRNLRQKRKRLSQESLLVEATTCSRHSESLCAVRSLTGRGILLSILTPSRPGLRTG